MPIRRRGRWAKKHRLTAVGSDANTATLDRSWRKVRLTFCMYLRFCCRVKVPTGAISAL
jgi:hypothetical protein